MAFSIRIELKRGGGGGLGASYHGREAQGLCLTSLTFWIDYHPSMHRAGPPRSARHFVVICDPHMQPSRKMSSANRRSVSASRRPCKTNPRNRRSAGSKHSPGDSRPALETPGPNVKSTALKIPMPRELPRTPMVRRGSGSSTPRVDLEGTTHSPLVFWHKDGPWGS